MTALLDVLELAGAASVQLLWLPVIVWTAFWLLAEACLRASRNVHPAVRYRAAQAVLLALPGGIVLSAFWDVSFLIPPITVVQLIPEMPAVLPAMLPFEAPAAMPAEGAVPVRSLSLSAALGFGLVSVALLAVLRLVRLGAHAHALRRMRSHLTMIQVPGLDQDVETVVEQLGLGRKVTVVVTADEVVPMTFGLRHPFVVLPASLSAEERRLALAHELVHVRHRDYAAQWLEALVGAVFAFHPAVHRLRQQCHLLREMACDAALLAEAGISRRSYAALVYSFVTPSASAQPIGVGMADSRPHLHQRFTAMQSYRPDPNANPYRASWLLASAVLAFGCLFLTSTQVFAQERPVTIISLKSENPTPAQQAVREAMTRLSEARERGEDVAQLQAEMREAVTRLAAEDGAAVMTLDPAQSTVYRLSQDGRIVDGELIGAQEIRRGEVVQQALQRLALARGEGASIIQHEPGVITLNPSTVDGETGQRVQYFIREGIPVTIREGQRVQAFTLPQDGSPATQEQTVFTLRSATATANTITGTAVSGQQALVRLRNGEVTNGPRPMFMVNGELVEGLTLEQLSPGNIENIQVLSGEVARARFGEAGANGVVLITLKAARDSADVEALQAVPNEDAAPVAFAVHGAYPNPFGSTLTLDFSLPERAEVRVELFDITGRRVLSSPAQSLNQGARHTLRLDGSGLAAGTYTYRLVARTVAHTHRASGIVTVVR